MLLLSNEAFAHKANLEANCRKCTQLKFKCSKFKVKDEVVGTKVVAKCRANFPRTSNYNVMDEHFKASGSGY